MALTKIDRELAKLDPDIVLPRQIMRLAWARSSLTSHPKAQTRKNSIAFGTILVSIKEKISQLIEEPELIGPSFTRPLLPPPALPPSGSFRPARYFSKGALDTNPKKSPAPIPYLLIETRENAHARPVPGNTPLLRSLCKGKGVLTKNKEGMIYLDIDNRFITTMIPYLKAHDLVRPPYFNLFGSAIGAHIPIIPSREAAFHYIDQIKELGKEYSFEIEGLYSIEPTLWPEVEQVWFFKLRSMELEDLRQRYFLTSKPGGHSFHIAVAVKPRPTTIKSPQPQPLMRINVAYLAA